MSRYIDADKLKSEFDFKHIDMNKTAAFVHHCNILEIINQQPTADVRENIRGEWIYTPIENGMIIAMCSICKKLSAITPSVKEWYRFCPNCGADMRGGKQ